MRYIRLFERYINSNSQLTEEELKVIKFRIGDYVKIIDSARTDIFVITAIDYLDEPHHKRVQYYICYYPSYERFCWTTENSLQLVPDYEADAKKYNM